MDYAQSGSHVFIESSRQSYMSHCRHHTHWMSYSSDHDTRQTALSVRVSGGLGVENECPKSCSGAYGACTANGCRCIDGYSGHDCSIKLHGFAVASNIDLVSYSSSNGYSSARADKLTAQGEADASKAADGNPSSGAVKSSREYLRYATTFIFALMITIAI